MENSTSTKKKKSLFESPLLSTKIHSAKAKIFPEGAIGYLVGPTLALLANSILSGYFNQYMSDVLKISGWGGAFGDIFFTWLPVVSVIFVVLGNILVGRLLDRNPTKAGKARPWLLLSVPVSLIALIFLFILVPNPDGISASQQIWGFITIAIGYILWFGFAYPLYYTPHAALVNLSTRSGKDRSLLATISNATALAAMGLSSMILPFFLSFLFKYDMSYANMAVLPAGIQPYIPEGSTSVLYYIDTLNNNAILYDQAASYHAWMIFVIALIVITAIGALIEFYFTRERVTEESFAAVSSEKKAALPMKEQAKICFKDKFWWIMIAFFFLYQLGGMMKNVSQLYYCAANFPDAATGAYGLTAGGGFSGTIGIIGAIPTAIGMVIAWPLSNKIGKGKSILFGAIISVLGGVLGLCSGLLTSDPNALFGIAVAAFVIKALGSTPAMYLSLALLGDILDHQEALHGKRTDGFTMMIYGAIMAGMTGIATGIMNGVLAATGVLKTNDYHAASTALTWIFFGGETLCYVLILVIFIFMGVEKFSKFDHVAIVKDQRALAEAEGREYVDPAVKLKMEEAEAEAQIDEERKANLRKRCEKQGLDFEAEEAKYQAQQAEKQKAADAKKAAAEAKKAEAEKAKKAKYDALSAEEKAKIEAQKEAKAKKKAEYEAAVLKEYNKLRVEHSQEALASSELEEHEEAATVDKAETTTEQDEKNDADAPQE